MSAAASSTLATLRALAKRAGFPDAQLDTAAAVAMAESGGVASKVNRAPDRRPNPEVSVGLWQVNVLAHPEFTEAALLDPAANARAAYAVFQKAGGAWSPWSTFTHGDYRQYMPT